LEGRPGNGAVCAHTRDVPSSRRMRRGKSTRVMEGKEERRKRGRRETGPPSPHAPYGICAGVQEWVRCTREWSIGLMD
jgi:hypothetical protein